MTAWIWLSTLFSFAILVFLAIAGKETPIKFIRTVPLYVYGVAAAASIVGLIGAVIRHGTPSTYLFSLFGMPFHEGFRVTVVTSILNLALYLIALYITADPLSRIKTHLVARGDWTSQGRWRLPGPNERAAERLKDEMPPVVGAETFEMAIRLAWCTFALSLLILAPTLGQAAFVVYIVVLGTGWIFVQVARQHKQIHMVEWIVLYVLLCLSYVAQTASTWSAWHNLHTVELPRLYHGAANATMWHSPEMVLWLSFFGFIGEAVSMLLLFWLDGSARRRPSATLLGVTSLLYLRIVAPFSVVHGWQWGMVVLDVLFAATPIAAMAFDFRPDFLVGMLRDRERVPEGNEIDATGDGKEGES